MKKAKVRRGAPTGVAPVYRGTANPVKPTTYRAPAALSRSVSVKGKQCRGFLGIS